MEHDQKQFLELLQEHKSEDTKKARRNVSVICFVVIAVWWLGIDLKDVRVLGADISKSAEVQVLVIAGLLIVYWLAMFVLCWSHDKEIQKERTRFLELNVKHFNERFRLGEQRRVASNGQNVPMDYSEAKAAVEAHKDQQERTRRAATYGNVTKTIELWVPIGLSAVAFMVLVVNVVRHAV